jgi:PEGA domain
VVVVRGFVVAWMLAAPVATAAPRMALVALGDCRAPDLLQYARLFEERLSARVGPQLLDEAQFHARVGLPPTHTLDEVRRQVTTAENLFYNDRVNDALGVLDQALIELERLPPGNERWKTYADAQLIRGMALSAVRRRDASDDAFRSVLRLDPKHVMSPDAFSPLFRQRFEKLRAELARSRKARLNVQSQPSGGGVFLDGIPLGHTPITLELPPGNYQVIVGRTDAFSFSHPVSLRTDSVLRVDVGFEQSIPGSRVACLQQPREGRDLPLGNALKLGMLLEVEQMVVLRLDRPPAGPSWLAAAVLNTQTAQRTREGGIQLGGQTRTSEDLPELARFVVTGETGKRVVVVDRSAAPTSVLSPPPPAPAPAVHAEVRPLRTWRTPAGISLVGVGVASVGLGVLFQITANDSASKFNQSYANGSAPLPSQVATVDQYRSDAHTQQTLAYVGYGVGAAAIGTGLWLWLTDGKVPETAVVPGPHSLTVAGKF